MSFFAIVNLFEKGFFFFSWGEAWRLSYKAVCGLRHGRIVKYIKALR